MVGTSWVEGTAAQRQAGWHWGWKSGNWIIEMKSLSECTGHVESFSSAACGGATCFSDCSCWTATARDGQLEEPAAGVNYGGRVVFSENIMQSMWVNENMLQNDFGFPSQVQHLKDKITEMQDVQASFCGFQELCLCLSLALQSVLGLVFTINSRGLRTIWVSSWRFVAVFAKDF